jgi:DNA-binding FadR family transcriptional regulator
MSTVSGALAPQRLTAMLADRLRQEIESGRLGSGAQLPTETQMMQTFRVSRTVVREAVAELRAGGLVVTQQGRGAFVTERRAPVPRLAIEDVRSLEDVLHVMELRLALESDIAALAARRRTDAGLELIRARLLAVEGAIDAGEVATEADFDFHLAIAAASSNPYFERLLGFLGALIIPRQRVRWGLDDPVGRRLYLNQVQAEHEQIVAAIAAGNPGRARTQMRRHLEQSRQRYQRLMFTAGGTDAAPAPRS